MSTKIIHKHNTNTGVKPHLNQVVGTEGNELDLGEIAINTHDGKMFIRQDQNGDVSLKEIGAADQVDNVLYVSKSGNDSNSGKTLSDSFATIRAALESLAVLEAANPDSTAGTTIFVKSGTYIEDNDTSSDPATAAANPMGGMVVPKNVSIVGDNLRTTRVRGSDPTNDLFYVQNASYITNLTFERLNADPSKPRPPAAVSFPPIALQRNAVPQEIQTSPYVENCTSFCLNATGMLIDGSLTTGLRSMVSDSFTQINAGGRGVHLLNRGYAQLVSIFTVSCDYAILCESGGQCSLTNSNASFGNYGLKATGASDTLYAGALTKEAVAFDENLEITTTTPPKYGDAFLINDKDNQLIAKCGRDVELILDAVAQDIALETNFNSIYSGIAYKRAGALPDNQVDPTSEALFETKRLVGLLKDVSRFPSVKANVDGRFDVITSIINNGAIAGSYTEPGSSQPNYTTPTLVLPNSLGRHAAYSYAASNTGGVNNSLGALLDNRVFIQDEITSFINAKVAFNASNSSSHWYNFTYNSDKCRRDIGYIVDSLCYDLMYGGNSATLIAARSYFDNAVSQLGTGQTGPTVETYGYLADVVSAVILNTDPTGNGGNKFTITAREEAQTTVAGPSSAGVATEAHDLVEIIKDMIEDGDLEELPALVLPTFPSTGDSIVAKNAIQDNKRELRQATTDWVIINTGIEDNFYYSVEGVESSIDFTTTDYNGFLPLQITSGQVDSANDKLVTLQRQQLASNGGTIDAPGITGHGLVQGQPVKYACTGTPITGLISGQVYFVIKLNDTEIQLSTTQRNFWETGSDSAETIGNATMSGTHTLTPGFYYNTNKCERDVGLIIDAVRDDMLLGTNFNSVYTGISYQRASAYTTVTNTDQKAPTLAAMLEVKKTLSQLVDVAASDKAYNRLRAGVDEIIHIFEDGTVSVTAPGDGVADELFLPNTLNVTSSTVQTKDDLMSSKDTIVTNVFGYIEAQRTNGNPDFAGLTSTSYQTKCARDIRFIVDALAYDLMYNTNTASIRAAESYFITTFDANGNESSVSQLAAGQTSATIAAYEYMRDNAIPAVMSLSAGVVRTSLETLLDSLMNIIISHIQNGTVTQPQALGTSGIAADLITASTAINDQKSNIQSTVGSGVDIYRVIPLENVRDDFLNDVNGDLRYTIDFRKRSLIAASSMTFEYVGTGTEIKNLTSATDDLYNRPRTDDFPQTQNEVIEDSTTNLGAVYFTSTDHKGDFRIGSGMRINRTDGTIEGDTFNRSLFSVMTPYILAIEGN